jgi:hypothetical protein
LVSINVPNRQGAAVVDAMERDMAAILATKSDVELLRKDVEGVRLAAKSDIELLRASMTIRLGSMLILGLGILLGTLRWVIH